MTLGAATPTAMGAHDEERGMLKWFVRRAIWDFLAWLKFRVCKPLNIKPPPTNRQVIKPKPMIEAIPEVPLRNVMVCAHASIPQEERSLPNTLFYRFQVWLYTA